MNSKLKKDRKEFLTKTVSVLIWVFIYHVLSISVGKSLLVPSVYDILSAFAGLCTHLEFWNTVFFSVIRVIIGFVLAVASGTLLGALSYRHRVIYNFIYPILSVIKAAPVASFIILALLWIRSGHVPAFISFLMVLPMVWSSVLQGLNQTDSKLLQMAEIFDFSFKRKVKMIYIPQVIPYFKTACITGLGFAWKSGIAAEVISTPNLSIGRKLYESKIYLETPELFAWTFTVIVLSIAAEKVFKALLNRFIKIR